MKAQPRWDIRPEGLQVDTAGSLWGASRPRRPAICVLRSWARVLRFARALRRAPQAPSTSSHPLLPAAPHALGPEPESSGSWAEVTFGLEVRWLHPRRPPHRPGPPARCAGGRGRGAREAAGRLEGAAEGPHLHRRAWPGLAGFVLTSELDGGSGGASAARGRGDPLP